MNDKYVRLSFSSLNTENCQARTNPSPAADECDKCSNTGSDTNSRPFVLNSFPLPGHSDEVDDDIDKSQTRTTTIYLPTYLPTCPTTTTTCR